ncbi:EamA family transporter [Rhodoferax sp. GW822-FHT02A01]|uniref:DMT family transporter n=1 Tax=Rhodoferax sp. GW822-FHT02A01 TaxID=3141537 RepID=UPI00315D521B
MTFVTRWAGVALIALAALSWSTAGLFPRMVSTDVFTTLFWRSLLGGSSVLAIQMLLGKRDGLSALWRLTRAELWMSLLSSGAMVCFIAAFFFAPVADVVFIYSAFPVITLLLSALVLRTRVRTVDLLCTLTVVAGMGLIVWGQSSMHSLLGSALSLLATLLFALITVGIKRHPQAQMIKVTYMGTFLAALAMAPFSTFANTSTQDLAWLWLYGVLNVGVGFGLYLLGVRRTKAVLASLVCMIEIPLAPLWVYALFGEKVAQQSLIGGAVIVLAVLVNVLSSGRGATAAAVNPVPRDPSANP